MQSGVLSIKWLGLLVFALTLAIAASGQTMQQRLLESLAKLPHPSSAADFQPAASLPCLNQDKTLVCWSFATCSFLESEMARLKLPATRLSVMYPVYCGYLEKARRYVQTKGASRFSPGDLFTGLPDPCREYGALPASVYDKPSAAGVFDQTRLYPELEECMHEVKLYGQWDEARVLSRVKVILNRHLGEPPKTFSYEGRTYTPSSFVAE